MEDVMGYLYVCKRLGRTPVDFMMVKARDMGVIPLYSIRVVLRNCVSFASTKGRRVWIVFLYS